jgi:hypothetical protein
MVDSRLGERGMCAVDRKAVRRRSRKISERKKKQTKLFKGHNIYI